MSTYSVNSLVISVRGIILTAGQDGGPNQACEELSSTSQLLPDDVTNQKGQVFIQGFGMVRKAENQIVKKNNFL